MSLAKLLQNTGHDDEKVKLILEMRKQFPENKDVIRYHAITMIKQQMAQEIDMTVKSKQTSFKERIAQDLKKMTRN